MEGSILDFYNDLSESYHLIYPDWQNTVSRQGELFNQFIRSQLGQDNDSSISLLDASCGIGTQCLGLAQHGFKVTATDLSPKSVERAQREAEAMGLDIRFGTADFRTLDKDVPGTFQVVLTADNAVPHLLTDDDLQQTCQHFYEKCSIDGLLIITIRDYDELVKERQHVTAPRVFDDGKRVVFQVWDWAATGKTYTTNQFIVQETDGKWKTDNYVTSYRALLREELSYFLQNAGFEQIQWHMPAQSGYYQPIVTARKK